MATICVYCASSRSIDQSYVDLAYAVGTELARRGHVLVTGGGTVSMMGAVARGARAGGAHTIGVIPHALLDVEMGDEHAELVIVDSMRERKKEMERLSDDFLALPGGIGTMEELFEMWTSRALAMHDKPVVVLDPDNFFAPLWTFVDALVEKNFVRPEAYRALTVRDTVEKAIDAVAPPADPEPLR
jgi:uncharacterized protein (TIGR00730 family)